VTVDSHNITYTISIGVAPLTDRPKNYMAWLEQADQAMYSAKQAGRNQIVTFS
jgi:diguanylate cyclase (GGDEF)-like protein